MRKCRVFVNGIEAGILTEKADAMIERSFLSPDLKHLYMAGYHYRQSMIRPE